jgi:hypothetical protein
MGRHNRAREPISVRKLLSGLATLAIVGMAVSVVLILLLTELDVI